MAWVTSLLAAAALLLMGYLVVSTAFGLLRNYAAAHTIGVPIRFIPISPLNPFWVLVDRKVLGFLRRILPDNSLTRYNWRGWEVKDRYRSHQEMGDIWVLVAPFKNWIYVNDPQALSVIFRRGNDFPRAVLVTMILDVFGPNISTAEGQAWKTQRKIAFHCFNESNNDIVWQESITLARDMLSYWTSKPSIDTAATDMPTNFIAQPWLPKKLRDIHAAYVSFRSYMTDLYEEEKAMFAEGRATDSNLMRSMFRASQEAGRGGLTETEIYGNMFVFNFAGHDTTAHTFTFAMYFLAAHPEVQDWLAVEISNVLGNRKAEEWNYRADFPRLKRCLAVMYETIRLYVPVPVLKRTADKAQSLVIGGKTLILPVETMIAPSYGAVHTDPRFWGHDALKWGPKRFVVAGAGKEDEELRIPVRGAFVEFVATMAVLFHGGWRVEPVLDTRAGESLDQGRKRVLDLIENDSGSVLLLQMLHPERAPLKWRKG
ncbi:Cytochrome P450 [Rhypophila sp. PSN 637]